MRRRAFLIAAVLLAPLALAKNGAFRETGHGDRTRGPQRRADQPRGACVQCHDANLVLDGGDELCLQCHQNANDGSGFAGPVLWARSTHGQAQVTSAPIQCVFCHEPHGVRDARGVIPAMLRARSAATCGQCHDGSRAANVADQLNRTFVHGAQARGVHDPNERDDAARFAASPRDRRHVDCGDCHNVHVSAQNGASAVSRVEVDPRSVPSAIRYTFRSATDPGLASEWEVCFKCHSSWTKQPARQSDLAELTLPENPSFHPIQAEGRNVSIARESFTGRYGPESRITCTDCHGSDEDDERGLHGSRNEHLLKRPDGELCFSCHSFDVYASAGSDTRTRAASRFNGHAFHVAEQQLACSTCHDPHGSTRFPALLVRANGRGILNYEPTPAGATCQSTCHQPRTYTVSYPR